MINSRDAVGGQLAGFCDDFFDGLRGVFPPHFGDRAERTQTVATFRNLEIGKVPGGDSQPVSIRKRLGRRRSKHGPLLVEMADQTVCHAGHLLASKHAHDMVNRRPRLEQGALIALGKASGHDDASGLALSLEFEHLVNDGKRLRPCRFDETTGVHHDEIGSRRVVDERVSVQFE